MSQFPMGKSGKKAPAPTLAMERVGIAQLLRRRGGGFRGCPVTQWLNKALLMILG